MAVYKSGDDEIKAEGTDSVVLKPTKKPVAGDTITVTAPTNYLKVKHSKFGETILYLPDKIFTYVHQSNASVYMSSLVLNKALTLTFSTPTEEELTAKRNLALNPYDFTKGNVGFPHATSNNVYDQSGQFIPRNAIDGVATNKGHGNTPYQSWGPKATVLKTDYFTIDFGRAVTIDSVVLYLRADGFGGSNSHDAYFKEITLEFSDGSSVTVNPTSTVYTFAHPLCDLTVTFLTPLLCDRPEVMSRPVSYVFYKIVPVEEGHTFEMYIDASCDLCGDEKGQNFVHHVENGHAWIGAAEQNVLNESGDDVRIGWGYLHLVHPNAEVSTRNCLPYFGL